MSYYFVLLFVKNLYLSVVIAKLQFIRHSYNKTNQIQ